MARHLSLTYLLLVLSLKVVIAAQTTLSINAPVEMVWEIDGVARKALVYIPTNAKTKKTPIIFAFHGHGGLVENGKGGTMQSMYQTRRFDELWPEAIFVCPQGLNTPGKLVDQAGKFPGWQKASGEYGDRDLKFFDEMLASFIKNYNIDQQRIYSTGHSNGGGFTYLLWATRSAVFAAVAPSASSAAKTLEILKPKPVLHIYGEKDELVKTAWQVKTCNALLKINKCDLHFGERFANYATLYKSSSGNPTIIYRHPGGHSYPKAANAVVIKFFKEQQKSE